MIIFTNVRKSVDYKDFILRNIHPAWYRVEVDWLVQDVERAKLSWR